MSGQKKLSFQIEAFKHNVTMDQEDADNKLEIFEHAIRDIFHNNISSSFSFQEQYRDCYSLVLHKFGEKLYSRLVSTMISSVKEVSDFIEAAQGELFLEALDKKWTEYNKALQMIRDIVMYMDRTFIPSNHKTHVHELGLNVWRDNVIHSSTIRTRLLNVLLDLMLRERSGEVISTGLVRNVIKMLMDLGSTVYQEDFEQPFLEATADFYKSESQKFIGSCNSGDYLKMVERCLNKEMERLSNYLDTSSERKIMNVVEKEMIENHMLTLVSTENSGLEAMVLDDKYEDLGRMYTLFHRVPKGLATIRDAMTSHFKQSGDQLLTDSERLNDPQEFVERLVHAKDKYDKIISLAFNNDEMFQTTLNSSFEYFTNLNPCHSPVKDQRV